MTDRTDAPMPSAMTLEHRQPCQRCGVLTASKIICDGCWRDWKLYAMGDPPPVCRRAGCDKLTPWDDGLCDDHGPAGPS